MSVSRKLNIKCSLDLSTWKDSKDIVCDKVNGAYLAQEFYNYLEKESHLDDLGNKMVQEMGVFVMLPETNRPYHLGTGTLDPGKPLNLNFSKDIDNDRFITALLKMKKIKVSFIMYFLHYTDLAGFDCSESKDKLNVIRSDFNFDVDVNIKFDPMCDLNNFKNFQINMHAAPITSIAHTSADPYALLLGHSPEDNIRAEAFLTCANTKSSEKNIFTWWVILLIVLGSLLVLSLIIFVLYRYNLLSRLGLRRSRKPRLT